MTNRGVLWSTWFGHEESESFSKIIKKLGYRSKSEWIHAMKRETETLYYERMEKEKE